MVKRRFITSLFAILLGACLYAQDADVAENVANEQQETTAQQQKQDDPQRVEVDGQPVVSLWLGHETELFGEDGSGRWRYFMHGITDANAQPFSWGGMLDVQYEPLLSTIRVRNEVKESGLHSLCLPGGTDFIMARPMLELSEITGRLGSTIRMFIWIRGEDTGNGGNLWDSAPQVSLILRDGNGKEAMRSDCQFRTRGTFPWFCYHLDLNIPESIPSDEGALGGVFVRLANPTSGKAWFCTPSWEFVSVQDADAYLGALPSELADPKRGTFAPNPDYDEMPMNFFFGLPTAKNVRWRFMEGNEQARPIILSYDVEKYIERYASDWFHLTQAIPYLLSTHAIGIQTGRLQNFQADWTARLANRLAAAQNQTTGLWHTDGHPNLFATYLVATQCFSPTERPRPNEPLRETPWLAANGMTLPRADALARSILEAQNSKDGKLAGWNKYAFQGQDLIDASRDAVAFDVDISAAAVIVLMQCHALVSEKMKAQIANAVRAAYDFAVANVMDSSWHWFTDETRKTLCKSPMLFKFLEATQALDIKVNANATRLPELTVEFNDKTCRLTIPAMPLDVASIRVYAIPASKAESDINDVNLIGIIRNPAQTPAGSDPLLLLVQTCGVFEKEFFSAEDAGTPGIEEKIDTLAMATNAVPNKQGVVNIAIPLRARKNRLVITAADSYGNLTVPKIVQAP